MIARFVERHELQAAGIASRPGTVLADAGYWHQQQMERAVADGIQVLIPPDASRRANKPKRPGWDGGLYTFMRRVLPTDHGTRGDDRRRHRRLVGSVHRPARGALHDGTRVAGTHRRRRAHRRGLRHRVRVLRPVVDAEAERARSVLAQAS